MTCKEMTNDEKLNKLIDVVKQIGLDFAIGNIFTAATKAKMPDPIELIAEFKVSGVPYKVSVVHEQDKGATTTESLQKLLRTVTSKVNELEKTHLGMLSVIISVSIKKGPKTKVVGVIKIEKDWMYLDSNLKELNTWLQTDLTVI